MSKKYLDAPVASEKMPSGIPYIISNEAAERFSFYGMKGILVIFMTQYLFMLPGSGAEAMSKPAAMENYHLFTTAVYFFPIMGALLADIVLGKYLTIMLLSLVYCAGHGVLAAMGSTAWLGMSPGIVLALGLVLISVGSGGIKPCVSAHVGDQFGTKNSHLLEKVFGWFYFSINTGAFLSTMLTPWLLEWYGPHWAFGVPGVLMALATFAFWMGRKKFIHIPAGGMAWFKETFSGEGLKAILKLAIIFIFIAVFWALFDQTGSSWVLQAEDLNRNWLGMNWLSSQIQAVNPIMILVYIPVFQFVVYPLINKVFKLTPIRKISIGLFVMVAGFAMVGVVQSWIDAGQRPSIGWQVLAYAILTASEVMVSITGLEFAYTQAPKRMKSMIMALFLMSVALGNLFTAGVNHFIVVPDGLNEAKSLVAKWGVEEADEDVDSATHSKRAGEAEQKGFSYKQTENGFELLLQGWEKSISNDDIRVGYAPDLSRQSLVTTEVAVMKEAIANIGQFWDANDRLPFADEGLNAMRNLQDPWGKPLHYRLVNRRNFEITSEGPDQMFMTSNDVRAEVSVESHTVEQQEEMVAENTGPTEASSFHPNHTWIVVRKAEIEAEKAIEAGNTLATWEQYLPDTEKVSTDAIVKQNHNFAITWQIGGATTLAGAAYFDFFTWLMLGTAIIFVFVGYFYVPKTYIQDDGMVSASAQIE
ncbi:MAG: MFS transporter [Phycisphaerae bacterium]|nr:MFS transporter [Phycisphaerae bacterium]|tara:strand:+ start:3979 stop:6081 length:2103 start_codon:yes stop_codon:yes gene_type:complete